MRSVSIGWLARNGLSRHRPAFMAAEVALVLIGCMFWSDTILGGSAFTAEIWGRWAYSIPAIYWAGLNMGAAALTLAGQASSELDGRHGRKHLMPAISGPVLVCRF